MSNPYDPYNPNQGQQPYGNNPYGQPNPYGGQPAKTDAVSITGFIFSLTCCLSIVGAILGFIGLGRTKNGKRKGRWAAISASIIGVLGTLIMAGGIVFFVIYAKSVVDVDQAKVGQCINVDETDDSVLLREAKCDEKHDAEITWTGTFGEITDLKGPDGNPLTPSNPDDFTDAGASALICTALMEQETPGVAAKLGDNVRYQLVNEDQDPASSDKALCYVAPKDKDDRFSSKQLP
ncbi:DUF4190 domain-containing protein [Nocardioides sp. GXZ039]|uniref:DUF4190 domain-containing protein n=1 Tax=Nocardioides sp. GXZ039 TaxID=3136018 RepID=UPI0030F442C8